MIYLTALLIRDINKQVVYNILIANIIINDSSNGTISDIYKQIVYNSQPS